MFLKTKSKSDIQSVPFEELSNPILLLRNVVQIVKLLSAKVLFTNFCFDNISKRKLLYKNTQTMKLHHYFIHIEIPELYSPILNM